MLVPHNELRPIKIFGIVLIIFTFIGTLFFFSPASPGYFFGFFEEMSESRGALYFLVGALLFYFLTGLGVVLQRKWGYALFKLFLYIIFLGFPGTIISYMTLSYMRRHQIKRYFGFTTAGSPVTEIAVPTYMKTITALVSIGYVAFFLWMMIVF